MLSAVGICRGGYRRGWGADGPSTQKISGHPPKSPSPESRVYAGGGYRTDSFILMKKYTLAIPIHCFNHGLNLVLTKACDFKEVKIAFQTLTEVYNFIKSSNMCSLSFTEVVKFNSAKRKKLVPLCPTRWIEWHDAVLVFVKFMSVITVYLKEELDATPGLLIAIRDPRFLVGLVVVECMYIGAYSKAEPNSLEKIWGPGVSLCHDSWHRDRFRQV